MEPLLQLVAVIAILAVLVAVLSRFVRFVTVHDYERGLRFSRGRLVGLVPSGTHLSASPFSEIHVLDSRPSAVLVEGQEVMTADGVAVKVSLAARYVIADPVAAVTGDSDFRRATYVMLQLTLRDVLAGRSLDQALAARREIGPAVREACAPDLATIGIELLAVEVRDLMVPGELKRAFAAVIAARKEGEAALERARGETAALRNLANAGRMIEDSPGLLQLRIVQGLGASSGNTVVLGLDGPAAGTAAPVARRRGGAATPSVTPGEPAIPTDGV
ncbi:MAG TPA: slipin family protein [Vitreimonas sp.]|nr:slipin family protein [Vitreimonas sp.]